MVRAALNQARAGGWRGMSRVVLSDAALMEHNQAANLFDLFLSLYRSVAENGVSEVVRKVFSPWDSDWVLMHFA
jgi:hypothetical protein